MRTPTEDKTLDYMRTHPNRELRVAAIAAAVHAVASTVSTICRRATESDAYPVECIRRGVYIWRSDQADKRIPRGTLLEVISWTESGDPILQGDDLVAYIARRVK